MRSTAMEGEQEIEEAVRSIVAVEQGPPRALVQEDDAVHCTWGANKKERPSGAQRTTVEEGLPRAVKQEDDAVHCNRKGGWQGKMSSKGGGPLQGG